MISGQSLTKRVVVTSDGKLLKLQQSDNDYYFYADNGAWSISDNLNEVAAFANEAGGSTEVNAVVSEGTATFSYHNVNYSYEQGVITPGIVGELLLRTAYWRTYSWDDGGQTKTAKIGVNESGQALTKDTDDGKLFVFQTNQGQAQVDTQDYAPFYGQTEGIIEEFGEEGNIDMESGGAGTYFTMPATSTRKSRTYQIYSGYVEPDMENYAG